MYWQKKGLILKPDNNYDWMVSHAQIPVVETIGEDKLRLYFGTRNLQNETATTFIDVDSENPQKVLYVHNRPVLSLGNLGTFDDSGAMPSWIVNFNGRKFLFYIGWNRGLTVPYRNSIGIAVSDDGGLTFNR